MREGCEVIVDIVMGTIDREHLEKEYMVPEVVMMMDYGIPWFVKAAEGGFSGLKLGGYALGS